MEESDEDGRADREEVERRQEGGGGSKELKWKRRHEEIRSREGGNLPRRIVGATEERGRRGNCSGGWQVIGRSLSSMTFTGKLSGKHPLFYK